MPALVRDAAVALPNMTRKQASAPAVQAVASPPKEVRFPSDRQLATSSRERTEREAWSFYWFETHCKECHQCEDPYHIYKRGEHLCPKGEALARDMSLHVFMRDGEVYERLEDPLAAPDRVEIPHSYQNLLSQLKVFEKMARRHRRRSHRPVVQLDQSSSQRAEERRREDRYYHDRIVREERPKSDKQYERTHHANRIEIVAEPRRSTTQDRDEKGRSGRRRHSHAAEYEDEEKRVRRREQVYMREERPQRERYHQQDERRTKDHRNNKDLEVEVNIEMTHRDKKYRTEIRKPDRTHRNSYYN